MPAPDDAPGAAGAGGVPVSVVSEFSPIFVMLPESSSRDSARLKGREVTFNGSAKDAN